MIHDTSGNKGVLCASTFRPNSLAIDLSDIFDILSKISLPFILLNETQASPEARLVVKRPLHKLEFHGRNGRIEETMALTIHRKSVYLIIFNATMILRSVGKSLQGNKSVKDFKIKVFGKLDMLTERMDNVMLTEDDIVDSINNLSEEFQISYGQAQKPINVILKYHFYLTKNSDNNIKKMLHCPIDSLILRRLDRRGIFLTKIDKGMYSELQSEIQRRCSTRIEFDTQWDKQHLRDEGIL